MRFQLFINLIVKLFFFVVNLHKSISFVLEMVKDPKLV